MLVRDRLNQIAQRFYMQMGYVTSEGFDFSSSRHPLELFCYRLAEIAWEEMTGDTPDEDSEFEQN